MAGFILPYSGDEVQKALAKSMSTKEVTSAFVNEAKHLILCFSDGTELDCGYVGGGKGVKGDKGDKGDPGQSLTISKIYASIAEMNAGYSSDEVPVGGFVLINTGNPDDEDHAKLYCKGESAYIFLTDLTDAEFILSADAIAQVLGYVPANADDIPSKAEIVEEVMAMLPDGDEVAYGSE